MSIKDPNSKRRMVPRWRPTSQSQLLPETASIIPRGDKIDLSEVEQAASNFELNSTIENASEVLFSKMTFGSKVESSDSLKKIASPDFDFPEGLKKIAVSLLSVSEESNVPDSEFGRSEKFTAERYHAQRRVKECRTLIRAIPRFTFGWLDLALAHERLGQEEKARKAIQIAISLGRGSRFVARSASRQAVHHGDPERALFILSQKDLDKSDPWILAARLSVEAIIGKKVQSEKLAKRVIEGSGLHPIHLTELRAALGTLEIESGRYKKAKKLFTDSMLSPTDNSLAQAAWLTKRQELQLDFSKSSLLELSPEAQAHQFRTSHKWREMLRASTAWFDDEPFSTRAPIDASFVASVALGDVNECERFCLAGLLANPKDVTLRNNYAVSLAMSGRTDEAETQYEWLKRNSESDDNEPFMFALRGLIDCRERKIESGIQNYSMAMQMSKDKGELDNLELAALHLSQELVEAGKEYFSLAEKILKELPTSLRMAESTNMRERILEKLRGND